MAHKNTLKQKKDRRLQKQLTAYSVAAGAALALANPADASIVSNTGLFLAVTSGTSPLAIDIDGGGVTDFTIATAIYTGGFTFPVVSIFGANAQAQVRGYGFSPNYFASNLTSGAVISTGTAGMWKPQGGLNAYYNTSALGPFGGAQGYIGIQFDIGGSQHFGWIEYIGHSNSSSGTILNWAYENNAGQAINAGAVPLPGTFGLGLLALGAAGVARLRQRKKEVNEETA